MFRKINLSLIAISFVSIVLFADDTSVEDKIKAILPGTEISNVKPTPIPDVYYVSDNAGHVLHVDTARELIIFGEIYTAKGKPLTSDVAKEWQQKFLEKQLGKMTKSDIQEIVASSISSPTVKGRYELLEFTDPDCPFCKQAAEFLSSKNISRHIIFTPLPMHPDAKNKAMKFVSAKDPYKAYKEFDLTQKISKSGTEKVDKMVEIARKYNVNGTPYFIVVDNQTNTAVDVIIGAKIGDLEEWIRKNQNTGDVL